MMRLGLSILLLVLSVVGQRPAPTVPGSTYLSQQKQIARLLDRATWGEHEAAECTRCKGEKKTDCRACQAGKHRAAKRCAECKGKKSVPCDICVGKGKHLDPLVQRPCPRCVARRVLPCRVCDGLGKIVVAGGGKPSCVACGGRGGFACGPCGGKRIIAVSTKAVGLRQADKAELEARLAAIRELITDAESLLTDYHGKYSRGGRSFDPFAPRFTKLMARIGKVVRPFRGEPKAVAAIAKRLRKYDGSGIFATGRPIASGKTIPLEYRASLEAALAALYYERRAIQLSIAKRPRGGVR